MARNDDFDRRTVLRGAAGVLGAGVLAGCMGGNNSSGNSSGNGSGGNDSGGSGSEGRNTTGSSNGSANAGQGNESSAETDTGTRGVSANVEQWLASANGYDGSIADLTGKNTVQIAVGAGDRGFAFDPAAIRVSPGTTVRWTWVGGAHNVVAKDGAFNSGQIQVGSDVVYEATLDQSGTHLYYCVPHRPYGMKGVVFVGSA